MKLVEVSRRVQTRIPTEFGEFQLILYANNQDTKEHMAMMYGDIHKKENILTRVHSECFTGEVMGSLRCDCGEQLHTSFRLISENGSGVIIFLRQEGRDIGLEKKLKAYNLQDLGLDTVQANVQLGHLPDERTYEIAFAILYDLDILSIRLLTNNPSKVGALHGLGIPVVEIVSLLAKNLTTHNVPYLRTKADKMMHLFTLPQNGDYLNPKIHENPSKITEFLLSPHSIDPLSSPSLLLPPSEATPSHPSSLASSSPIQITVSFAQSLDGSIATLHRTPLSISGSASLVFTHSLRASHDSILIGVGTLLADNPKLNVRFVKGPDPQILIIDTHLKTPLDAQILSKHREKKPWFFCSTNSDPVKRKRLESLGARIIESQMDPSGRLLLKNIFDYCSSAGITSVLVEGGASILQSCFHEKLAHRLIVTIAPLLVGGLNYLSPHTPPPKIQLPTLVNPKYQQLGSDMIIDAFLQYNTEDKIIPLSAPT